MSKLLINELMRQTRAKSHAHLAVKLNISEACVSKIYHNDKRSYPVSAQVILNCYDATDLTISELRRLASGSPL